MIFLLTELSQAGDETGVKEYTIELLSGATGEFVTGIATMWIVANGRESNNSSSSYDGLAELFELVIYGTGVGAIIGTPTGVVLSGTIMRQHGSVLGAYFGGLLGVGLGIGALYLGDKAGMGLDVTTIPALLLMPPACSVLGYNILRSDKIKLSSINNFPSISLSIQPMKNDIKYFSRVTLNTRFLE